MRFIYNKANIAALVALSLSTAGLGQSSPMQLDNHQLNLGLPNQVTDTPNIAYTSPLLDTSNSPNIMYNQQSMTFDDAKPGMIGGQLMIPVRAFATQAGASVEWQDGMKQVQIDMPDGQSIQLNAVRPSDDMSGSDQGRPERFSSSASNSDLGAQVVLIGNRAYMPYDVLATTLNGTGNWDQSNGTVTFTFDDPSGNGATSTMGYTNTGQDAIPNYDYSYGQNYNNWGSDNQPIETPPTSQGDYGVGDTTAPSNNDSDLPPLPSDDKGNGATSTSQPGNGSVPGQYGVGGENPTPGSQ